LRASAGTLPVASASLRLAMICSSVNLLFFMVVLLDERTHVSGGPVFGGHVNLEKQLAAMKRNPEDVAEQRAKAEANALAALDDLRSALSRPEDRRRVFLALLPNGVQLSPADGGKRQVWRVAGAANLSRLANSWFSFGSDPVGLRPEVGEVAFEFHSLDWLLGAVDRRSLAPSVSNLAPGLFRLERNLVNGS
jgi:hypothetical protein